MQESTGKHHFFASTAMPHISCLSYGLWDGRQVAVQLLFCRALLHMICSRQCSTILWSSHLVFSPYVILASMWCIYIVVWTLIQLGGNAILFHWMRIFFHKCKFNIVWNWIREKIILMLQKISFKAIQNSHKSNRILQAWTAVFHQIFHG